MNDITSQFRGMEPVYVFERVLLDPDILTTAQTIRRLSYSTSQLYALIKLHGFPLPVQVKDRNVGWKAQDVDQWKLIRDERLHSLIT